MNITVLPYQWLHVKGLSSNQKKETGSRELQQ
jgi:hypothetical protein